RAGISRAFDRRCALRPRNSLGLALWRLAAIGFVRRCRLARRRRYFGQLFLEEELQPGATKRIRRLSDLLAVAIDVLLPDESPHATPSCPLGSLLRGGRHRQGPPLSNGQQRLGILAGPSVSRFRILHLAARLFTDNLKDADR